MAVGFGPLDVRPWQAALALYRASGDRQLREEVAEAESNKTIDGGIRRYHFVKTLRG